ncbi:MAG TPA: DNA polymerase III subunit gamma/tau [Clostridiales bacterium]|nr:DNA polymerase III subunit gamma/tau [Clostridiales bacterium]
MYQALYRKYRPQTFSDVVGQKGVTDTLRAQLETGKLSHAYLFTGTRGTGKTSCAKILAKAVNCLDPQDGNPCNCCAACRAIDDGSCMDVLEIDAASNNGVDSVRILRDDAIYTPSEVKKRVYIIDEVHMLSIAAFNALLKIIEEPPEHLLFILATTELNKVPATILSRCQRFSFRRLRPEDIADRLNFIAYQEGIQIEPAALRLLSRLADGALRDGVSLLDQCASACTGELTEELVCRTLGLAGAKRRAEILMAAAKQDTAAALSIFETLYAEGKDLGALFDELSALCRDLLVLKAAPKSGISMLSGIADEAQAVELEKCLTPAELLRDLSLVQAAKGAVGKNADARVAAELCLMQLCEPALKLDLSSLGARVSKLESRLASGDFAPARAAAKAEPQPEADDDDDRPPFPDDADDPLAGLAPPPSQPQSPADSAPQTGAQAELDRRWPELAASLRDDLGVRERGFFAPGGPVRAVLKGDTLILTAQTQFVLDIIKNPRVQQLAAQKASAFFGRPMQAQFALAGQTDASGKDPMDVLIARGKEHSDIMTIR